MVPLPRPDALASERMLSRPLSFISSATRLAISARAFARAEFRTPLAMEVRASVTFTSLVSYTIDIQVSGIPDAAPHRFGTVRSEHVFDRKGVAVAAVAAVPTSREALLGPASQRLEVGLLGARTAAVLRRIVEDAELDEADRAVLRSAADMLARTAEAVAAVAGSGGGQLNRDRRSFGFGAMAFTVELAAPKVAAADLPEFLREMAGRLSQLTTSRDKLAAQGLLPAFSTLADVATRQAGTVGEGGGSLT